LLKAASFIVVCALLFAFGCAKPSAFQAPVSKFHDAATSVLTSTKAYYTALNKSERDHYIDQQVAAKRDITLIGIDGTQLLTSQDIAARLKALDVLSQYSELLYQLANSTSPSTIQSKASDLQKSVTGVSDEINKLGGSKNDGFKNATNAVFPIIGQVLQAFVNSKIEDALKNAINTGTKPVNDFITALEIDMTVAYERKRNFVSGQRSSAVQQYEQDLQSKSDQGKLQADAQLISTAEDNWEAFQTASPTVGLEAMKQADDALEKFVKTPKPSITDFSSFVSAMDAFASIAQQVSTAVQQLEEIK
jgi:hypothetical protein